MPILGIIDSAKTGRLSNPAYESIATITVTSAQNAFTFSSIPSTYKHLQLRGVARSTRNANAGSIYNTVTINGIALGTSGTWAFHRAVANGAGTWYADGVTSTQYIGMTEPNGAQYSSGNYESFVIDILDYTSTNKGKTFFAFCGETNGGGAYGDSFGVHSGMVPTSSAISSITFTAWAGTNYDFDAQTQVALYGIK